MQIGCRQGGLEGHFSLLTLVSGHSSSSVLWMHCHSPQSVPPLCSRPFPVFSVCLTPFLSSAFTPLFSLCVSESSHLLPTLPYFSKFSPALFFPVLWRTRGWNRATAVTPSAISGDYCNNCVHPSVFPPSRLHFVLPVSPLSVALSPLLCLKMW